MRSFSNALMLRQIDNSHSNFRLAAALVIWVITGFASEHRASGSIIIDDAFTGPDNTALIGRMPAPTDVPATAYQGNGNVSTVGGFTGGTPYEADIQSNAARVGADAGLAVDLNIATATQFQLSISFDISDQTETQANNPHRGA